MNTNTFPSDKLQRIVYPKYVDSSIYIYIYIYIIVHRKLRTAAQVLIIES